MHDFKVDIYTALTRYYYFLSLGRIIIILHEISILGGKNILSKYKIILCKNWEFYIIFSSFKLIVRIKVIIDKSVGRMNALLIEDI